MHVFHPSVLREYDIRGIVGETLSAKDAYAIGRAFASFRPEWKTTPPVIAVGRDGRESSPELEAELVRGLTESGANVVRIGVGPTPMLYFSVCSLKLDGGVMITGSHNPPTHNGFKFMLGLSAFFGEDIKRLGRIAAEGAYLKGGGKVESKNIEPEYTANLLKAYTGKRPLTIAWDAGNGATGNVMQTLCKGLPGTHHAFFAEIDGTFPNHHPDPSDAHNLQDIIREVKEKRCDAGIAFDGDGDRIGVVDETGEILAGDQLLAILAADVLKAHKGAIVIGEVKASKVLFDEVARLGGKPLMWKTGHSLIKSKMAETGALLAGEVTGHIFFKDKYYGFDDALYAAIRVLSLLAESKETLSSLRRKLPQTHVSPEWRIPCPDERKFVVMEEVKTRLTTAGAEMNTIDGVRVNSGDGWWLLRASNTQAALSARYESGSKEGLEQLKEQLRQTLAASGVAFS